MAKQWMARLVALARKRGTERACHRGHMGYTQVVVPLPFHDPWLARPAIYKTKLKRRKQRLLPSSTPPIRSMNRTS